MAAETVELDKDAFMRLVTEGHLQVEGPSGGYLYTGKQGRNGWELYKTANNPWYLYSARRVATQTNVAGGAVVLDIALAAGQVARLVSLQVLNSGTNSLTVNTTDEDDVVHCYYASAASAAAVNYSLPTTTNASATATGDGTLAASLFLWFGPGMKLTVAQSGAGADNDTLTVAVTLLLSTSSEPTWSKSRSTNAADVTLADSTISAENTMRLVAMP